MKATTIIVPEIKMQAITVDIIGTAPLVVHRFGVKARREILDKQMKKAKKPRESREPEAEYLDSLYKFKDSEKTGFPATGFKGAMMRGCKMAGGVMIDTRVLFYILPDGFSTSGEQLVEIDGDYEMREDVVRIGNGSSDLRYRPIYPKWSANLNIEYNSNVISAEQIINLVSLGGLCGIGEGRPEKSNTGCWGTFKLLSQ